MNVTATRCEEDFAHVALKRPQKLAERVQNHSIVSEQEVQIMMILMVRQLKKCWEQGQYLCSQHFMPLLSFPFHTSEDGVLQMCQDDKFLNIAILLDKTKVYHLTLKNMLFADDAELVSHTQLGLKKLIISLTYVYKQLRLTISLKKNKCIGTRHQQHT